MNLFLLTGFDLGRSSSDCSDDDRPRSKPVNQNKFTEHSYDVLVICFIPLSYILWGVQFIQKLQNKRHRRVFRICFILGYFIEQTLTATNNSTLWQTGQFQLLHIDVATFHHHLHMVCNMSHNLFDMQELVLHMISFWIEAGYLQTSRFRQYGLPMSKILSDGFHSNC